MLRKCKMLGRATIVVFAMSAVMASAAHAAKFTASTYPTAASGVSQLNDDFKTEAGYVECSASFSIAALAEPSETVTVTPTYYNCKAFGFLNATINMNGCDYTFRVSGSADLNCPAGKVVEITAGTCKVTIGAQFAMSALELTNTSSRWMFRFWGGAFSYSVTQDGFGCPFGGTGAKAGGYYAQGYPVMADSTNGATTHIG